MKRRSLCLMMISLSFFIFNCDGDEESPTGPDSSNIIEITEDIDENTTWSGDNIYVIKKYDFYINKTLTIQPGTIIKFTSQGPYCILGTGGTINASGTSTSPIVFTSYKDDASGGDTNGDGSNSTPGKKDWGRIDTNGENGSVFNYCHFYYGGGVGNTSTLCIAWGSRATVTNCTFALNDGSYGSGWSAVLDAGRAESGTVIQNNVFYDNVCPMTVGTKYSLDHSNVFHNPGNASQTNTRNHIFTYTTDHIEDHITWQETEVAFVIDDGDFWINSGASLTLGNNVVLKFKSGSCLLLQNGASALVNHDGSGVFFTSYKDDAHGGDSNGDGSASSPANNDWLGIYDDSGTTPNPYYFTWSNILYDSY